MPEQYLVIPLSSFPELTLDECVGLNADIRKVFYAIADAMYEAYITAPEGQRPQRMQFRRNTFSGVNQIDRNYSFEFDTFIDANEIANETD